MANEIDVGLQVDCTNGEYSRSISESVQIDQSAQGAAAGIVIVGQAAEEDLEFIDISSEGMLYLKNLDATNFVKYGPKSGGVMVTYGKIKPGEIAWVRLFPGVVHRWIADTDDVKVEYWMLED